MTTPEHTLLLVEHYGLARMLAPMLSALGWRVLPVATARGAMLAAQQHLIEAMVVALYLPYEGGDVAFFRITADHPELARRTVFLVQSEREQNIVAEYGQRWIRLTDDIEAIGREIVETCGRPTR